MCTPEEYDGMGSTRYLSARLEEISAADAAIAVSMAFTTHPTTMLVKTTARRAEGALLKPMALGAARGFALSEAEAVRTRPRCGRSHAGTEALVLKAPRPGRRTPHRRYHDDLGATDEADRRRGAKEFRRSSCPPIQGLQGGEAEDKMGLRASNTAGIEPQ